jgi:RHS repeat-associated protein
MGASQQSYKYNDKEFIEMHGYDTYDYMARGMYPASARFTTMDPLCELYYSWSPYAYCMDNPVKLIDPNGLWPTLKVVDNGSVGNRGFSVTSAWNAYHKLFRPHYGQDFRAAEGNSVHALATGVVSKIGYDKDGWGYYVDIKHSGGYKTRYAHLQKDGIKVKKGDGITTDGEVIALSGMTGGATGPHLHLEVLLNGKPVNPMCIADLQRLLEGNEDAKNINDKNPIELSEVPVIGDKSRFQSHQGQDKEWDEYIKQQNEAHSVFQQGRPHEGDSNYQGSFWQAYDSAKNF